MYFSFNNKAKGLKTQNIQEQDNMNLATPPVKNQAPVDNTIHWIIHYPTESTVCFVNNYPIDRDLLSG